MDCLGVVSLGLDGLSRSGQVGVWMGCLGVVGSYPHIHLSDSRSLTTEIRSSSLWAGVIQSEQRMVRDAL